MEKEPGTSIEALIRRLRLHQAPPSPYSGDPSTAATPAAANLFQPRRAAVLVCLFHDAAGELRVLLTKRASSLSTHSGEQLARYFVAAFDRSESWRPGKKI
uniref:Nudix hydrolase domain-containing protein n=1 Tax=Triticum urartu TaxID=4572 RepID=A0A8R7R709_TRIUA